MWKESYLGKIRYFETKSYFDSHGLVFEKIARWWRNQREIWKVGGLTNIINICENRGVRVNLVNHPTISKPWGWFNAQRDVIMTWFPEPFRGEDVDRGWKNRKCTFPNPTTRVDKAAGLMSSHKHVQRKCNGYLRSASAWQACKLEWKAKDGTCGAPLASPPSKCKVP